MNSHVKSILTVTGLYVATMVAAVVVIFAAMLVLSPDSCSDYSKTAGVIWALTALLFLASAVGVGLLVRRHSLSRGGQLATVLIYSLALLVSYFVFAFGILVAFNC